LIEDGEVVGAALGDDRRIGAVLLADQSVGDDEHAEAAVEVLEIADGGDRIGRPLLGLLLPDIAAGGGAEDEHPDGAAGLRRDQGGAALAQPRIEAEIDLLAIEDAADGRRLERIKRFAGGGHGLFSSSLAMASSAIGR